MMVEWYWVLVAALYAAVMVFLFTFYNEHGPLKDRLLELTFVFFWPVILPALLPYYAVVYLWRAVVYCPEKAVSSLREKGQMEAFRKWINEQEEKGS